MTSLDTLPSLEKVIARFQLATRKSLGQHFLLDSRITDTIVRYAGDVSSCHVIEVGPGPGGLTRSLLKAGAKKLYAIEKDERCLLALAEISACVPGRLDVLMEDALEVPLTLRIPAPRKLVANLPYNVGTPMLINWLGDIYTHGPSAFESLTLMFQKEVAERVVAAPGCKDFGRLSVLAQWLCEVRYDMELPPDAFSPPPRVESAVITLTPRAKPLLDVKKEHLERVVAQAFGQRRKMLRAALKGLAVPADALLEKAGVDGALRAEQLDVLTLCRLARCYQDSI